MPRRAWLQRTNMLNMVAENQQVGKDSPLRTALTGLDICKRYVTRSVWLGQPPYVARLVQKV